MKRTILILMAVLLAGSLMAMPPPAGGREYVSASLWGGAPQDDDNHIAFVVCGGYGDAFQLEAGFGIPIAGNLYTFLSVMGGDHSGSLNGKFAYLLSPAYESGVYFGLTAGPGVDWQNIPNDNQPPMAYILGATGLMAGYSFNNWGIFGQFERKFPLEKNALEAEYTFRLGAAIDL